MPKKIEDFFDGCQKVVFAVAKCKILQTSKLKISTDFPTVLKKFKEFFGTQKKLEIFSTVTK